MALLTNWKLLIVGAGVVLGLYFLWDLSRDYKEGQRAIGAADAVKNEVNHVDAVNKARSCVRACRDAGGVWNDSNGRCGGLDNLPSACR